MARAAAIHASTSAVRVPPPASVIGSIGAGGSPSAIGSSGFWSAPSDGERRIACT
uniref:hypothetical protein n=1 Tax=Marinactinospora thermotolerans TaxID=531310 RepID=UPI00135642AC|nr:hypothetical protein [Marinactinospora thermotolerans]